MYFLALCYMYKLCTLISIPSTPVHVPSIEHILNLSQQHHRAKKRAHDSITEEDLDELQQHLAHAATGCWRNLWSVAHVQKQLWEAYSLDNTV